MENTMKKMMMEELTKFHCSILLDEVKEKVRKLKAYGVDEGEILSAMNEEELFPQLKVTKEYNQGRLPAIMLFLASEVK